MLFNRKPLVYGGSMDEPSQELVRNTLGLVNASLDDAVRYGGELTRAALSIMGLRGDRKHYIVDTKVHMLMPGIVPALPGWHTDGVPRGRDLNPLAKAEPRIDVQEIIEDSGGLLPQRPTHYHMLVTGRGCLTEFMPAPVELEVRPSWSTVALYGDLSKQIDALSFKPVVVPSCTAVEFDWWDIHRGVVATEHEWRFFIRVAETDLCEPERDLRKVVRTQHQVYAPDPFGW